MTAAAEHVTLTGEPGGYVESPDGTLVHFIDWTCIPSRFIPT